MTDAVARAVDWDDPPDGLDRIAADLRAMRAAAADPSYAEIGRRVAQARAARGVPEHERRMPRTTLYSCFRDGRRRIDADAVVEIALALGLPARLRSRWAARLRLARAASDGAAVAAVHDDVPLPVRYFTGRAEELHALRRVIAASGAAWISGMAGAGKTQLALRLVDESEPHALFLDLRGHRAESPPVEPAAAQRAILRTLGADEDGTATERRQRLHRALAEIGRVLVLDDAAGPRQVSEILGEDPGAAVVVTSRTPAQGHWTHLPLGPLDGAETAALLRAIDEGAGSASDDTDRLVEVTGGLPLAIALVGGRLTTHPGWTLREHVDLMASRLASARVDSELRTELGLSYIGLTDTAARLLRAFADLPVAELSTAEAAVLLDVPSEVAEPAVTQLVEASLAVRRGGDRIALHSLVRAYGRERAEETDPPRARQATFARLGQVLAEQVWAAYSTIAHSLEDSPRRTAFGYPSVDWNAEEAGAWLRTRLASLLALAHAAPERDHPELLFRISEGLSWWMSLVGHHADALRLHEAAADLAAELGDADALAMASLDAGQLLVNSDRPEEAYEHFSRATHLVADAGELSDPGLAGLIANMSALIDLRQGRLAEARRSLERAVELHDAREEDVRLISALVNLGVVLYTQGDFAAEGEVLDRAFAAAQASGHGLLMANVLVNRAELRRVTGDLAGALADAEEASGRARELGSVYLAAAGEMTAAQTLQDRGELGDAARRAAAATDFARELGLGPTIAEVLLVAAALALDLGERDAAREQLDEADTLLVDDADHVLHGRLWRLRGELAEDEVQRERCRARALERFERAGSFEAAFRDR